jgi:hypothetical protein
MNNASSRSHLVSSLFVTTRHLRTAREYSSKLTLVDLAGSESAEKSGAVGSAQQEASCINRSLSALGDVMAALRRAGAGAGAGAVVPFRNSKLTYVLKDALEGDAKMVVCCE